MSLAFYRLEPPVTSLRAETFGQRVKLSVWVEHALAGALMLPINSASNFILSLTAIGHGICLYTHFGGPKKGLVVDVFDTSLADDTVVVSAVGTVTTIGEVKGCAGAGRRRN